MIPCGQHLAEVKRKNSSLTGRDLQHNQAQGVAIIFCDWLEGQRGKKRERAELRDEDKTNTIKEEIKVNDI